jgi:peptidoglycan/xylan/chitin deacetylase (PgdA/CDA1 family)
VTDLNNKNKVNTAADKVSIKGSDDRKKRIKRLKTFIIIIAIILLLLPTIFCIILGIQVSRLQNQMDQLVSIHGQYGITNDNGDHYAFAAEITKDRTTTLAPDIHINDELKEEMSDGSTSTSNEPDTQKKEDNLGIDESSDRKGKEEKKSSKSGKGEFSGKKVYLTFDDGPSSYTNEILDILKEYDVNATFFVIGRTDIESKEIYQRIVDEGHTLGMHSYSHVYKKIYNSVEDFDKDFTKLWKLLYDTTGYKPSIYRFPGGSDNLVNKNGMEDFIRYLKDSNIVYFDWNVLNGDATGVNYTKEQLIRNVINGVKQKDTSIVLMHDSLAKKTTIQSLRGLLDQLVSGDAQILPLNEDVPPIQMIKADSIQ